MSSVPLHLSVVWPEGTPARACVPVLGVHPAIRSLCYYLSQQHLEQIKGRFKKQCFIHLQLRGPVCGVQGVPGVRPSSRDAETPDPVCPRSAEEPRGFLSPGTSAAPIGSAALILAPVRPAKHDKW